MRNGNVKPLVKSLGLHDWTREYRSNEAAFEALRRVIGRVILGDLGLSDVRERFPIGASTMCIGVSPAKKELARAVNDALLEFKRDGTLRRLRKKWLSCYGAESSVPWHAQGRHLATATVLFVVLALILCFRWKFESGGRAPSFRLVILTAAALFGV